MLENIIVYADTSLKKAFLKKKIIYKRLGLLEKSLHPDIFILATYFNIAETQLNTTLYRC